MYQIDGSQEPPTFWMHVPFDATEDINVEPPDRRITVLGHTALFSKAVVNTSFPGKIDTSPFVRYCLLFDPLSEEKARALFSQLKLRLQILSFRYRTTFVVSDDDLKISPLDNKGQFNGPLPTLISADLTPTPSWAFSASVTLIDAEFWFGIALSECPVITDERILSAIDLSINSDHDKLPRSAFLSHLTIIDSLAVPAHRNAEIQCWLDEKIDESKKFSDPSLHSSLRNLKFISRGAAIRALVKRAAEATSVEPSKISHLQIIARDLYAVRSALSHAGSTFDIVYLEHARMLSSMIINAAIQHPDILDIDVNTVTNR